MSTPASSTPLRRKKRNFKALNLCDDPILPPPLLLDPVVTQPVPGAPGAKKRPPPLGGEAAANGFVLDPAISAESPETGHRSAMHATISRTLATFDFKQLDLKNADLRKLADLGHGNGGSVVKVEHVPTGTLMAKKILTIDAKPQVQKQILRELQFMHDCHSKYIISWFGSFLAEPNICICMEFMDKGSFDLIYKKIGAITINVVCLVAHSVLEGLTYLYTGHRIIHRDIKPSNILLNSEGEIKLCDFGVSGELINSIATSFVGTSIYMSPERIQGMAYSTKSDIWSLGITLIELAKGQIPFPKFEDDDDLSDLEEKNGDSDNDASDLERKKHMHRKQEMELGADGTAYSMSIIELMSHIVCEPAPRLGPMFSEEAEEFVNACLTKNPDDRHGLKTLLGLRWMDNARNSDFDLRGWTTTF